MNEDFIKHERIFRIPKGNMIFPVQVEIEERLDRLWFKFGYNPALQAEIKMMEGHKWHGYEEPPIKQWSVANTERNWFQIDFLSGLPVYDNYDKPLKEIQFNRNLYQHQKEMAQHIITRKYCQVGVEMGCGKTLSAITAMEYLAMEEGYSTFMYVAPKSALISVQLEFQKWGTPIRPLFCTYEKMTSLVENWPSGQKPPQCVIFDESSRLKTPTAKRSLAAYHLGAAIRKEWGDKGCIVEMTGTPAPKDPLDWYFQTEILRPGYLKEGTYSKFRATLAVLKNNQTVAGQAFQTIATWRDDPRKCNICGKFEEDHDVNAMIDGDVHVFQKSVNEVERLYKRLKGLVYVKRKKDCLDLPDKIYHLIHCKPSQEIMNAAKLITATSSTAIETLTLLRELSDGFQYQKTEDGKTVCPGCAGNRTIFDKQYCGPNELHEQVMDDLQSGRDVNPEYFKDTQVACPNCDGSGEVIKYIRTAIKVETPKDDAMRDLLDQHDEVGRLVTYAGFAESVDRCVDLVRNHGWHFIRVDGRGWLSDLPGTPMELIKRFQEDDSINVGFVAQSTSGGMGLTLTASPSIVYFSNDFNGESRSQSEDRIHRIGMDKERGANIYDLIHLPTDLLVLENLKKKRRLEQMTLGECKTALESADARDT